MKALTSLLAVLALVSCTGCGLVQSMCHNVLAGPRDFIEDCREDKRDRAMAEQALCAASCGLPRGAGYSRDFADGFCDGYIDFMKNGGSGEPPPLPPRRYWSVRKQNEKGRDTAHDWFDGYRQGAAAARGSGARLLVTVPTSTSDALPPFTHMTPPPPTILRQPLPATPAAPVAPTPTPPPAAPNIAPHAKPMLPATPRPEPPKIGSPATEAKPAPTPQQINGTSTVSTPSDSPAARVGLPAILTPQEQLMLPPRFAAPPLPSQPPQPPLRLGKPSTIGKT